MLFLLDFRWYPVVAAVALLAGIYGTYHGYRWADRSAQVKQLERTVAQANATIEALQETARRANQAAASYAERESQAQEDAAQTRELIDALAEPDVEVCVLREADVQRLRDIAVRAGGRQGGTARAPLDIRVTRGRTTSP